MTNAITLESIRSCWARLRDKGPRVHCITNTVVQGFTANVLLASGAIPSMTTDPAEIGDFARRCDALLVNLGTMDADRREAVAVALDAAEGKPFVLDPVFVDTAIARRAFAVELLSRGPAVVRGNCAEITAVCGTKPSAAAAKKARTVLAVSAETDRVITASGEHRIENGHPYAALVTGAGCALSALMAALAAVEEDASVAAATAFAAYGLAQQNAATHARGPGTFAVHLLDALHALTPGELVAMTRLS